MLSGTPELGNIDLSMPYSGIVVFGSGLGIDRGLNCSIAGVHPKRSQIR